MTPIPILIPNLNSNTDTNLSASNTDINSKSNHHYSNSIHNCTNKNANYDTNIFSFYSTNILITIAAHSSLSCPRHCAKCSPYLILSHSHHGDISAHNCREWAQTNEDVHVRACALV